MIDKLHYISQATENSTHLDAIEKVLNAGGKWIQLRVKNQSEESVLALAIAANKLCKNYGAKLIINDYPQIAVQAGTYGLHLGLNDMPIKEARAITGNNIIIGGTANTYQHILQRVAEGADYIGLGPYRFTNTKQNLSPVIGLQGYETIMNQVSAAGINIPIIAIGGIELDDIIPIVKKGLHGVAISGALTNQTDAAFKLKQMYNALQVLNTINH